MAAVTTKRIKMKASPDNPAITPEARGCRLKRVRNLANLSRREMCTEDSGLKINTLKGWEIGKFGGLSKVGADKVVKRLAAENVFVSKEWLLAEVGPSPSVNVVVHSEVEQLSTVSAADFSDDQALIQQELQLFKQHYPNSLDLLIIDDAMASQYQVGDCVAGIVVSDEADFINQAAIVVTEAGETLCRMIRPSAKAGHYALAASNPQTTIAEPVIHQVQLKLVAKVIWHRQSIHVESSD